MINKNTTSQHLFNLTPSLSQWLLLMMLALCQFVHAEQAENKDIKLETEGNVQKDFEKIEVTTNLGKFELTLNRKKAPISVENFLNYIRSGFYDGSIFHRVIPDFMVQGGGFTPTMDKKPTLAAIKNEAKNGLKNLRGTIAMARTSAVDSASSQFFINLKNNPFLDHGVRNYGYAVFGRVTQGMSVIDQIASVPTGTLQGYRDVPKTTVIIEKVDIVTEQEAK